MKALLLSDGDLAVSRRDYVTITGTGKIAQDLRTALLEPIGNDRFHPGWGSTVHDFIATIADETTRFDIESEVNRVISNYAAVQQDRISTDFNADSDPLFTTNEILSRIERVEAVIDVDSVKVGVSLRAASGEVVVLNEAVR